MSVTISAPKAPAARTTTNDQETFELDQTKIALDSESDKNGVRNLTYLYNSGVGPQVKYFIYHNKTVNAGSVRTEISIASNYLETDSVSGRSKTLAMRRWGLWTTQPSGILEVTPELWACDLESLVSLFRPSVSSGVASNATIQKLMDGGKIW